MPVQARAMSVTEYSYFLTQIITEDGSLDCVPPHVYALTLDRGSRYLLWYLPNFRREQ